MTYRKKLIEVALPLDAINAESAREKSIRHGHPSTLHLWWARRPLAACRVVLFAQMVDDPSSHPELFPTEAEQTAERERLFDIIRDLVLWENVNNEKVLEKARAEIRKYAPPEGLPPVLDPFAGGGSIPLEAQRLGLEAHASDLNPVAVLINKALIEIPPKFANLPPVNPESQARQRTVQVWRGAQGLAEDVRYYGQWMRDEAEKRIGHLYPTATVTEDMLAERPDLRQRGLQAGDELTVIAWLWTRTVPSPNPATNGAHVPLVRSFWMSTKPGKKTWVEPVVDRKKMTYRFATRTGKDKPEIEGTVERTGGTCLLTNSPMPFPYIREQGQAGNMQTRLMAIVAEGKSGRIYLAPDEEQIKIANSAHPNWRPEAELPDNPRDFKTPNYGMRTFGELFTDRQLVALTTFSDLVGEARPFIVQAALAAGWDVEKAEEYGTAVATYLAFAIDRSSDFWCTIATWSPQPKNEIVSHAFTRQAIPMT